MLAFFNAGYPVTILSRSKEPKKEGVPEVVNVEYAIVDYTSVDSWKQALTGHFGVVSTLTTTAVGEQDPLIVAVVAAGTSKVLPSEFGSNTTSHLVQRYPGYSTKLTVEQKLAKIASENTDQ